MTTKPDLICRDNVLMPGQLQFVHPETGALIATVNANTPEGKYTVAAMFIGFEKVGYKIKDETHLVTTSEGDELPQVTGNNNKGARP
jgi:hypothetical protein